jgi:hypothetical protein
VCGFTWASVPASAIADRVQLGATTIARDLRVNAELALLRPSPDRWSVLEYGAHVRDVILHLRDRFVIGLVEDDPTFKPLYREERVALGLYAHDTVEHVAKDLEMAANLFARTFAAISTEQLARECHYTYPTVATRTLLWMAQQMVHEIEHHLGDVALDLQLLDG